MSKKEVLRTVRTSEIDVIRMARPIEALGRLGDDRDEEPSMIFDEEPIEMT